MNADEVSAVAPHHRRPNPLRASHSFPYLLLQIARQLEYIPLSTGAVIEQATGVSIGAFRDENGEDELGMAEVQVVVGLSTQVRSCISTLGGGYGAAAREGAWRYMHGQVAVWLDTTPTEKEESAPQRGAYQLAEVHLGLDPSVLAEAPAAVARSLASRALESIEKVLEAGKTAQLDYAGKKNLYIKLGCRGDWPNIMPPEWQPDA